MASTFPGAIDSFTDPLSGSALNSPSHSAQHADLNDAAEKIETYMGLIKVIPTSVTNGTLSATGTITVGSGVASITVNGAFSSLYDVYLIVLNGIDTPAAGNNITMDYDDGTSLYNWANMYMNYNSTTIVGARAQSQTSSVIGYSGNNDDTNISVTVRGPNLAKRTTFSIQENTDTYSVVGGGGHDALTQHTKFKIGTSGVSFTGGTIVVYGYRK